MLKATFKIVSGNATWGSVAGNIQDQADLINLVGGEVADINSKLSALGETVAQDYDDLDNKISDLASTVSDNYNTLDGKIGDNTTAINNHIANKSNPHAVTKAQVGLGNVDNTSDLNKPISTATQTALDGKVPTSRTVNSKALTNNITLNYSDVGALPNTTTINDLTTEAQQNALNSGATSTNIGQIGTNTTNISNIQELIPNAATSNNQLADKDFVNSSISSNTANFIGTFNSVTALNAYAGTVTNNDYAFVVNSVITDNDSDWATFNALNAYDKTLLTNFDYAWVVNGSNFDLYRFDILNQTWNLRVSNTLKASVTLNTAYNRYKATVSGSTVTWEFEYTLNNSSFTAAQWAAINSGATVNKIDQIDINTGLIQDIQTTLSALGSAAYYDALDFATASQGTKADTALQPNDNITELNNNAGYITGSAIINMQTTSNLVTSVSSASTDSQYPSAKLFYDTIGNLETLLHTINSGNN